jgi:hypothetical protein
MDWKSRRGNPSFSIIHCIFIQVLYNQFGWRDIRHPYISELKGYIMGLFNTILTKLGLRKEEEEKTAGASATATAAPAKPAVTAAPAKPATPAAPAKPAAPAAGTAAKPAGRTVAEEDAEDIKAGVHAVAPAMKAISEVDVVKKLEQMAEGSGLDWKVSIVDLLKVLKIDSSLDARKELAQELGCPPEFIGGDYSKMNVWLHKTVLKKIAENGGNIPANLLD